MSERSTSELRLAPCLSEIKKKKTLCTPENSIQMLGLGLNLYSVSFNVFIYVIHAGNTQEFKNVYMTLFIKCSAPHRTTFWRVGK